MGTKRNAILFIGIIGIAIAAIFLLPKIFNTNNPSNTTTTSTNNSAYSWAGDPRRLALNESVYNLTLIVDYQNGTNDRWDGVNLTDHYTSCFDLLTNKTRVDYTIYYFGGSAGFYITSINGRAENGQAGKYWQFYHNGTYSQLGSNYYQLDDNMVVEWKYGITSITSS